MDVSEGGDDQGAGWLLVKKVQFLNPFFKLFCN